MIGPDTVVGHSPEVAWVSSEDRVVIVRLDDLAAQPLVLSGSASVIWTAVETPVPLAGLVERVASAYDRSADDVRDEVTEFVASCRELRVLHLEDSA